MQIHCSLHLFSNFTMAKSRVQTNFCFSTAVFPMALAFDKIAMFPFSSISQGVFYIYYFSDLLYRFISNSASIFNFIFQFLIKRTFSCLLLSRTALYLKYADLQLFDRSEETEESLRSLKKSNHKLSVAQLITVD